MFAKWSADGCGYDTVRVRVRIRVRNRIRVRIRVKVRTRFWVFMFAKLMSVIVTRMAVIVVWL